MRVTFSFNYWAVWSSIFRQHLRQRLCLSFTRKRYSETNVFVKSILVFRIALDFFFKTPVMPVTSLSFRDANAVSTASETSESAITDTEEWVSLCYMLVHYAHFFCITYWGKLKQRQNHNPCRLGIFSKTDVLDGPNCFIFIAMLAVLLSVYLFSFFLLKLNIALRLL